MAASIQKFTTTPIRMAYRIEDHHLRQLDQILRTDDATIEYIAGTKSLAFTKYEMVDDLIHEGNPADDPLFRLEVKQITPNTHVALLFLYSTDLIKLTILNDDSKLPDFRHTISAEIAAWLEEIKTPRQQLSLLQQPVRLIAVMCLVALLWLIPGILLLSGDTLVIGQLLVVMGGVVTPLLFLLFISVKQYLVPTGQFNFGAGRKSRQDER